MPHTVHAAPSPAGSPAGMTETALRDCVRAAVAAPSIHNTQPWRFRIRDGGVDVLADRSRQLAVIDPSGRELLMSIGAAVFNIRITMRQQGRVPILRLFPDPDDPDLVAQVAPGSTAAPDAGVDALAEAIPHRHTNRRPFAPVVIPISVREELSAAAQREGGTLRVADAVGRAAILSLVRTADQRLRAQGGYRAELADWTLPRHGRRDGIPALAFGPWDAMEALPLRDFGLAQPHLHRVTDPFEPYPTIVVLATQGDTAEHRVRAGQALQRVLLTAAARGVAATPMSQPLELPELRELLTDTTTGYWAQLILRLGYAQPAASTPRRPLADVLD